MERSQLVNLEKQYQNIIELAQTVRELKRESAILSSGRVLVNWDGDDNASEYGSMSTGFSYSEVKRKNS